MVINEFKYDIETICSRVGISKSSAGANIGIDRQYVQKLGQDLTIVNKKYEALMDSLGYDIELVYIKKTKK